MKKIITITLFCIFMTQLSIAQKKMPFQNYNWDITPNYKVDPNYEGDILSLKNKVAVNYVFEEGNAFTQYQLQHRALWLNSDDKIEEYNKIYLPYHSGSQLLANKARVITKTGQIIELDKSDIFTARDEETGKEYKYFAFEGVQKGSIIEYFYVVKKYPQYKGTRVTLQYPYDSKDVQFDLYAPKNIIFKFKSYNGLPDVVQDTTSSDPLHWYIKTAEIKGLKEEEMSPYNASREFLIYKLDKNLYNNTNDISSYGIVAQNLYEFYYPEYSKKVIRNLDDLVSEAHIKESMDIASKIRKLEYYIKTNIYLSEGNAEELSDLEQILDQKVANETGIMKLFTAAFRQMDIPHEIVITSDRTELKFDQKFEAHNYLNNFLFYFPDTKAYMSPTENASRYGYPPANFADNYGLFIREVKVGDFKSGIGQVKYIEPVPAANTLDKMFIEVAFEPDDISTTNINLKREFSGYYAMYIQPYINRMKKEDREEFLESFGKQMNENVEITSKEMTNDDPELFGIAPLKLDIKLHSDAFIEKAGNRYLFKVGELIGQQTQLYQEKERVLPLENEFERAYERDILIHIPEGYRIMNPEDLNMDESYSDNEEKLLSFRSYYELDGNQLKITADEFYKMNLIEPELYEQYRKVINSAADFNKITLVLEPVEDIEGTR